MIGDIAINLTNLTASGAEEQIIDPNIIIIIIIALAAILFGILVAKYIFNKNNNKPKILTLAVRYGTVYINNSIVEPKIRINIENSSDKEKTFSIAMKGDMMVISKMRISSNLVQVPPMSMSSVILQVNNTLSGNVTIVIRKMK